MILEICNPGGRAESPDAGASRMGSRVIEKAPIGNGGDIGETGTDLLSINPVYRTCIG
jgi:hypothetical protein